LFNYLILFTEISDGNENHDKKNTSHDQNGDQLKYHITGMAFIRSDKLHFPKLVNGAV